MNSTEKEFLDSLGIFIKPHIINRYSTKTQKELDKETRFYYYKKRYKTYINKENIFYDKEVSCSMKYKQYAFYKMTHLSNEDPFFDFYFTLKPNAPKLVAKEKNNKPAIEEYKYPVKPGTFMRQRGKVVVSFE